MKTKKFIIHILFIQFCFLSFSQNNDILKDKLFYFNSTLDLNKSKDVLNPKKDIIIIRRHKIKVIKSENNIVEFRYLHFSNPKYSNLYNIETYKMSLKHFNELTNTYYGRFKKWSVGTYTVPFRLRSKNNDFEFQSNFSLGANLIKGVNLNKFHNDGYLDFSVGIALTKINLIESNSNIKEINEDLEKLSEGALTFSFGVTINFSEKVNVGVFYGWDFLDGVTQKKVKWIYNKKPWVGFGINISLKNIVEGESTQETQSKQKVQNNLVIPMNALLDN